MKCYGLDFLSVVLDWRAAPRERGDMNLARLLSSFTAPTQTISALSIPFGFGLFMKSILELSVE